MNDLLLELLNKLIKYQKDILIELRAINRNIYEVNPLLKSTPEYLRLEERLRIKGIQYEEEE